MESEVKHGGCYKCGSKEDKILISIVARNSTFGYALCKKHYEIEYLALELAEYGEENVR